MNGHGHLGPAETFECFVKSFLKQSLHLSKSVETPWYPYRYSWDKIESLLRSSETADQEYGLRCALQTLHTPGISLKLSPPEVRAVMDMEKLSHETVENAIFGWFCDYWHLNAEKIRKAGGRLIFGEWHQSPDFKRASSSDSSSVTTGGTCVGLINQSRLDQARSSGQELLTIAARHRPCIPFYEAVQVQGGPHREYAIIGTWFRMKREFCVEEVGARMVHGRHKHNASII